MLKLKIVILCIIPMILLPFSLYFPWIKASQENKIIQIMKKNIGGVNTISELMTSLQRERGLTGVAINSSAEAAWGDVNKEREKTDKFVVDLSKISAELVMNLENKNKLSVFGQSISELRAKAEKNKNFVEIFDSYSSLIEILFSIDKNLAAAPTTKGIGKIILSINTLDLAKENIAKYRGYTSSLIARKTSFSMEEIGRVISYKAYYEANLNNPTLSLSQRGENELLSMLTSETEKNIKKTFLEIMQQYQSAEFTIPAKVFFDLVTERITGLSKLIKGESGDLTIQVNIAEEANRINLQRVIMLMVFVCLSVSGGLAFLAINIIGSIKNPINKVIKSLTKITESIIMTGDELDISSQKISNSSIENAASLEETTSSLNSFSNIIHNSAENSSQLAENSEKIKTIISASEKQINTLRISMQQSVDASEQVGEIIRVIDNIAFKINMLALNAAIEAARAGEHGKGFGVVADSVRELAQNTATATKNIGKISEDSINKIRTGAIAACETENSLRQIIELITLMNSNIEVLASSGIEQENSIKQLVQAMGIIDGTTSENAAVAEESAAVVINLNDYVGKLKDNIAEIEALVNSKRQNSPSLQD